MKNPKPIQAERTQWEVRSYGPEWQIWDGTGPIAIISDEADASLMASGPDLLESLSEMLNQYADGKEVGWRKRMHDHARAVISRAEGRAQ